jgi:hypothetical protein
MAACIKTENVAKSCLVVFIALASLTAMVDALFNPYKEGHYERKTVTVGQGHVNGLDFELRVAAPLAEGNFPAIYFLGGFHSEFC